MDCDTLLTEWDAEHGTPTAGTTPVVLSQDAVRDGVSGMGRPVVDGDPATSEFVDVGGSVVLRLDEPRFLQAIRYTPASGEAAITDFNVYLSPSMDCWGEPAASGAFDGSDFAQEVGIDGRAARFVRIEVLGATGGAGKAAISELSFVVGAEVTSVPDPNAIVGVPWKYDTAVSIPGTDPLVRTLDMAPAGMSVDDDGVVSWTPQAGDEGSHEVVLRITRGPAEVGQSFTVIVAGVRVVGTGSTPSGGGTTTIDTSMGGMGPSMIEVTVDDPGAPAGSVEVLVVEGETAEGPPELRALGTPFMIDTDLPDGTVLHVRIPLAGIPGLPATNPEDSVFVTAYPRNYLADGPGFSNLFGFWDTVKDVGAVLWDIVAGDPGVYQINEGTSVVYEVEEFKITYMLDMGEDTGDAMDALRRVGRHVVDSREYFVGEGCDMRANQPVIIHGLSGAVGQVDQTALILELDKNHVNTDDDLSVRSTVAHELFHVFQIAALGGGFYPLSEFWWIEGNAAYMEDEVFDTNDWLTFYGPYDATISRQALKAQSNHYNSFVYWKSLKAQRGFNACEMIDQYATTMEGLASLSNIVGGDDVRLQTYTTYIAAWNHVRTTALLDDAEVFFPSARSQFVDSVSGSLGAEDYREYTWQKTTNAPAGGETARLELEEEGTMEITVRGPMSGFLLYVYNSSHEKIGEIDNGDMLSVEVSGDAVYLDVGIAQGSGAVNIDVFARIMAVGECSSSGAPCSGSGASFDDECCGNQICVVGACRPNMGGRERASCTDTLSCASGLICNEVGSEMAADTCCARDTDYCVAKEDCCGMMDCVMNSCVGRTSGEECLSGDCVGTSFCDGGTCT